VQNPNKEQLARHVIAAEASGWVMGKEDPFWVSKEGGREGGREGRREGGRKGGREEGKERGRERKREGGREEGIILKMYTSV